MNARIALIGVAHDVAQTSPGALWVNCHLRPVGSRPRRDRADRQRDIDDLLG